MDLEALRRTRRVLSAAVLLSAIALLMVKLRGGANPSSETVGLVAAAALIVSLSSLTVVSRKEHAAAEAAFAERERAQLAMLKLQVELAKKRNAKAIGESPRE